VVLIVSAGVSWWRIVVFGLPTTVVLAVMLLTSEGAWANPDLMPSAVQDVATGKGYVGLTEYTPSATDDSEVAPGQPPAQFVSTDEEQAPATGTVRVLGWSPEHKEIEVETAAPATIKLRIASYPAWQVRVNGSRVPTHPADVDGGMLVPVAPGVSLIAVRFSLTRDRAAGVVITLMVSFLCILALRPGRTLPWSGLGTGGSRLLSK
jgi:hypothetical protein